MPVSPGTSAELAMVLNGQRQLEHVDQGRLRVLELLLTKDIHRINALLRGGSSLGGSPNLMLECAGYSSMQPFVDDVEELFKDVGSALSLVGGPLTAYRGIGWQDQEQWSGSDPWGLRDFARGTGPAPSGVLTDPGISFASPLEAIAELYTNAFPGVYVEESTMTLELVVRRALCVPEPSHRGVELFARLYPYMFLGSAAAQLVIPPGTDWEVVSAHSAGPGGRSRLVLEQV